MAGVLVSYIAAVELTEVLRGELGGSAERRVGAWRTVVCSPTGEKLTLGVCDEADVTAVGNGAGSPPWVAMLIYQAKLDVA